MGKRWKALAVFAAFLLSLPTGCGTAEDLNATDTAKEETGAGTDTGGKGETAGESQTAGAYTYHLETEEMAWNTSDGEAALTVTLEYPVFEGDTEAEKAINSFFRNWVADKMASYEAEPDSLAEEALEFGESEVSAGAAPWADDYSVAAVTAVQGVISIRQDNYLFTGGAHGMPGRENHIFSETDEAHIGHLVQIFQFFHDNLTDLAAGNLSVLRIENLRLNGIDGGIDSLHRNRALVTGSQNPCLNLSPVILLPILILLDHNQGNGLHLLVSGKPPSAGIAHSSSADGIVLLHRPGVHHPRIILITIWTSHVVLSPSESFSASCKYTENSTARQEKTHKHELPSIS